MVNLKALEAAIQQVENVRDYELEFEANGLRIVLRALRSDEELVVQQYSQVAYEAGAEAGQAGLADYLDRMRTSVLGFAIIELGDQNLRDVEYLETGEVDNEGNLVSVPKHEAVRDLVSRSWSRVMLTHVFSQYSELLRRVEAHARDSVEFDPSDLDQEIERLESELKELSEAKKQAEEGVELDTVTIQQRAAGRVSEQHREVVRNRGSQEGGQHPEPSQEETASQQRPPSPEQDQNPQSSGNLQSPKEPQAPQREQQQGEGRRQSIPTHVPPPAREEYELESEMPERGEAPSQPRRDPDNPNIPEPLGGDSFFDPSEPDDAIRAESERQAQLMRQHLDRQRSREEQARLRREAGLPDQPEPQRPEPNNPPATSLERTPANLRQAVNTSDRVFNTGADQIHTARPQRPKPTEMGGKPVYKMPTQTLDKPQHRRDASGNIIPNSPAQQVPINPQQAGSRNPRFKGPSRE